MPATPKRMHHSARWGQPVPGLWGLCTRAGLRRKAGNGAQPWIGCDFLYRRDETTCPPLHWRRAVAQQLTSPWLREPAAVIADAHNHVGARRAALTGKAVTGIFGLTRIGDSRPQGNEYNAYGYSSQKHFHYPLAGSLADNPAGAMRSHFWAPAAAGGSLQRRKKLLLFTEHEPNTATRRRPTCYRPPAWA